MLNKNDPLIGAVQEVIKRNQFEREAAKLVNEKFGVHDRKALPHEKQGEWDAAYKQVLSEGISVELRPAPTRAGLRIAPKTQPETKVTGGQGTQAYDKSSRASGPNSPRPQGDNPKVNMDETLHPNQQKLDVHEPEKDKLTAQDFKMLRAKKKPVKEETLEERVKENKVKKNKMITKIGAKARKAGDPRHLNNLNGIPGGTGIRQDVGDKIRGRELTSGRERRPLEEDDVTSPSSMGIKGPDYATGTPDYAKSKEQTVNRAAKTSLPAGTVAKSIKEAKVNPYAVGMAAVKKSTGDEPPMEKKNIMKAHKIAKKIIAKKKMNEGFNNRHGLSVTASAEKRAVADQLNEAGGVNTKKARLAPIYTQGIKQTKARLAREPAEPAKSFSQRAAEIGRGVEAGARGFASGLTDVGQTSYGYKSGSDYVLDKLTPGRGQNLAREFPRTKEVGKGFGDLAGFVAGPEAALAKGVVKGAKYGSQFVKGLRATEKGAEVAADTAKATTKATQKYANAADELSAAERARFQRTLDAKMAAGGPAKKPVSQAAREPAADAAKAKPQPATQTTTQVGGARDASGNRIYNKAFTDLFDKAATKPSVAKASQSSVTRTTANPNSPIAKAVRDANAARETPVTPGLTAAGQQAAAKLAQKQKRISAVRRQVSGAEPVAPPKPATTQSGVPAVARTPGKKTGIAKSEKVGPWNKIGPNASVRPATPNAAAGNAARMAARQRLAAASKDKVLKGAAATGLGAAGLKVAQSQYSSTAPSSAAAAVPPSSGPSFERKGRGSMPSLPAPAAAPAKPNAPAPTTNTSVTPKAEVPKAAPQAQRPQPQANQPSATERRENRRLLDKGLVVGPEAKRAQQRSGTGVTIQQKAAPQVNRPVGTGRVK